MTRNRKVDPEVLEREYIYSAEPISYTQLAEKYGVARNTVAEKAMKGNWYKRREEFRRTLGEKAAEMLGEEWVRYETAAREKALAIALDYMGKYEAAMKDPEFKVNTRDFLGVMAMMRTFLGDAAQARTNGEEVLHDPDSTDLHPDVAARVLEALDNDARLRLEAGGVDDGDGLAAGGPEPPEAAPPTGPEVAGED